MLIPWHDADIHYLKTFWLEDGDIKTHLKIEINPEEDIKPLSDIGIHTYVLEVMFCEVWRLKSDLQGGTLPREVLLDWSIIDSSPLVNEIRKHGIAKNIYLRHHQIHGSSGSIVDIVFEQVFIKGFTSS